MRVLVIFLALVASALSQTTDIAPQLILDNDYVRVLRVTVPAGKKFGLEEKNDAVLVHIQQETAQYIPKGHNIDDVNATDSESASLLIELKNHWDADMRQCTYPMKCVRETKMAAETIAWTTTLFTNGFVTATAHKVVRGGTLASSYYTQKGSDRILLIPFTSLNVNFGGADENLKAGQPYFSNATEVEVAAHDNESRWFVLRLNIPPK